MVPHDYGLYLEATTPFWSTKAKPLLCKLSSQTVFWVQHKEGGFFYWCCLFSLVGISGVQGIINQEVEKPEMQSMKQWISIEMREESSRVVIGGGDWDSKLQKAAKKKTPKWLSTQKKTLKELNFNPVIFFCYCLFRMISEDPPFDHLLGLSQTQSFLSS